MKERNKIKDFSRRILSVIIAVAVMATSVETPVYASKGEKTVVKEATNNGELQKVDKE